MSADDVASAALHAAARDQRVVIPGLVNKAASLFTSPRPGRLRRTMTRAVVKAVKRQ
jgi:short-subunit dehydrogenase